MTIASLDYFASCDGCSNMFCYDPEIASSQECPTCGKQHKLKYEDLAVPITQEFVDRAKELTKGVKVNLNERLKDE